ncbi:MAG: hypothetical protein ACYDHP_02070 [Ferrimicrobium sp.]
MEQERRTSEESAMIEGLEEDTRLNLFERVALVSCEVDELQADVERICGPLVGER